MQYLHNIFHIIVATHVMVLVSCTGHNSVIPKKEMTRIIGEMFLADQYIEQRPELRAQTDTLILYEGVLERNGYTFEEYQNSVEYYLQQGDALKKIYINARKQIIKRRDELSKLVHKERKQYIRWWIADTISRKDVNALWKEPYLRNIKWLADLATKKPAWKFTDSTTFDTPQNALWWKNTALLNSAKSQADSLYPVLQRDYLIWCDNHPKKERPSGISDKKRGIKPDIKKYNKHKEQEAKLINEARRRESEKRRMHNSGK